MSKRGEQIRDRPAKRNKELAPLTPLEQRFVQNYLKCGVGVQALKETGIHLDSDAKYRTMASSLLNQPNIRGEINAVMQEIQCDTVASTKEVMEYFTAVMRGQVKDQFGLDASLMERTKAAQELAKRTVDIENRRAGDADQTIAIKIDWSRN